MCTAATYKTKDCYFGRNLDYEFSYRQTVTVTPRNYPFEFRDLETVKTHYAMIGMAYVQDNYPLYYDATNEKGLSIAGLNFPDNAVYNEKNDEKINVAPFEFIPYILCDCKTVTEAKRKLINLNFWNNNFSASLPLSPLHFMISDKNESLVVEPCKTGIKIYNNPVGIMTNNPTFDFHITNLINYMSVGNDDPINRFSDKIQLTPYSRGMGTIGLPGDLSSASRFIKATFTKLNSISGDSEVESVNQFFHILASVEQPKGCCKVPGGYEHTIYSSCCNVDKGIYYYTTYNNRRIIGVDMFNENLDSSKPISHSLIVSETFYIQNDH